MNQSISMATWGVLLAAGRGRRMGGGKQLLPWPPTNPTTTLVAASFDGLKPHVWGMMVVLGHRADEVATALAPRAYQSVTVDPDGEMMESIRAGLEGLESVVAASVAIVHPADHPTIRRQPIEQLLEVHAEFPNIAVMPEYEGRGGHPVLIPRWLWTSIKEFTGTGGLRQFWRDFPSLCVRVPVSDPNVVADFDAPSDYWKG